MKCRDIKKQNDLISKIELTIGLSIPDYITNQMNNSISQKQIAKNMGIEYRTLMKFMREYNIKSFTRHEAVKLQWVNNQERKARASARIKNWMTANPDQSRSSRLKANIKLQSTKDPTSIERAMMNALNSAGITYQFQYIVNDKFACDFRIMNTNIIIECDGDYWHSKESQKTKDRSKNRYLETCGYRVLRFSETQIKTNVHSCIQLILDVMHQPTSP
jgi:very-short-patch-repair endonuclease